MADDIRSFENWKSTKGHLLSGKRRWLQHPNSLSIGYEVEQELVDDQWRDIPGTMRPIEGYDRATERFLGPDG